MATAGLTTLALHPRAHRVLLKLLPAHAARRRVVVESLRGAAGEKEVMRRSFLRSLRCGRAAAARAHQKGLVVVCAEVPVRRREHERLVVAPETAEAAEAAKRKTPTPTPEERSQAIEGSPSALAVPVPSAAPPRRGRLALGEVGVRAPSA